MPTETARSFGADPENGTGWGSAPTRKEVFSAEEPTHVLPPTPKLVPSSDSHDGFTFTDSDPLKPTTAVQTFG